MIKNDKKGGKRLRVFFFMFFLKRKKLYEYIFINGTYKKPL
ncbi:hypothetical protein BTH41_05054 [Bacillus mycoides]|nr:hypothetical protein BTH41_05054 [Bacillus mycoides]